MKTRTWPIGRRDESGRQPECLFCVALAGFMAGVAGAGGRRAAGLVFGPEPSRFEVGVTMVTIVVLPFALLALLNAIDHWRNPPPGSRS